MKKLICALTALLLLAAPCLSALAEENLLLNGDFSTLDGRMPAHWEADMWRSGGGVSLFSADEDGYEGGCATLTNKELNDARFAQTVAVEPDSVYRLSGMIRASNCMGEDSDGGANLSVADVFVYSDAVYETRGGWQYVELYGRTGPEQTELTVFCRVGGYGNLSAGTASFDDISLVRLDEAPESAFVYDFYREKTAAAATTTSDDEAPPRYTESWLLFICIYALAVVGVVRKSGRGVEDPSEKRLNLTFWLLLAAAMLLRLIIGVRVRGYNTDINCFSSWSERIFDMGPARFYSPDYFCDYPPGYMLLLWLVSALRRLLGAAYGSGAHLALIKLIPMLADIAAALLVRRVARRRVGARAATVLGLLCAFNPAAIANSAAWGQIDGTLALAVALCALLAVDGRYFGAMLAFGAALLLKPQALLFAPVGLTAIVCGILMSGNRAQMADPIGESPVALDKAARRSGKAPEKPGPLDAARRFIYAGNTPRSGKLRALLLGVAACLIGLYAVAFVCCAGQAQGAGDLFLRPVTWLIELYSGTMQGYRYVTVNTLNLYYLFGMNWARTENHAAATMLAWGMFALAYLLCIGLTITSAKRPRRLFLTGGLLIVLVCTFGPMIHERYIFPGMLLLTLALACERDRRLLIGLTVLTATLFMNEVLVLQGGMTSANYGHLQSSEHWLNCLLSAVNVLNALFLAWTAFDICVFDRVWLIRAPRRESTSPGRYTLAEKPDWRMNLRRIDALLMGSVTLLYSVLAFTNLGVTKAPQTSWVTSDPGQWAVIDLGEVQTFRMTYYGGICDTNFSVELSNDGERWTEKVWAKYNQGEIFRWLWFVPTDESGETLYAANLDSDTLDARVNYAGGGENYPMQTARYVRLTAKTAGLILSEVGFLDGEGRPLPIASVTQPGQGLDAESLVDEQDTVPDHPSYLNSTYFDEIYHARTAYEHLHGLPTYEWTHPPLGKVTMMLGIQLFGMTPFGWRFMGALMGVLMVPLMYLLVKQLTKDTRLSFIAMALMALDSMHFTQTRIATIDSYAVFWIMVMYLFMFRYCQMSWNRERLGQTLVPLGLCGLSMGVAWATKWVGLYASAGLAILFFWTVFRRLREMKYLKDRRACVKNLVLTLLFCVAMFIVVPALIYYFSYYRMLRAEGVASLADMFSSSRVKRVVELQQSIFRYHSGLGGDTHYFRSPWYQWPIIWWPMWYYSGTAYMPEGMISSISCMGNPAVWWFGLAALLYVTVRMAWQRRAPRSYVMVVVAFASQFLPWVIVPRSTFIYHYFASVPFIIIASVLLLDRVRERSESAFNAVSGVLLAAALILFAAFYPLESGLPCARAYARYLRWFKWYNF